MTSPLNVQKISLGGLIFNPYSISKGKEQIAHSVHGHHFAAISEPRGTGCELWSTFSDYVEAYDRNNFWDISHHARFIMADVIWRFKYGRRHLEIQYGGRRCRYMECRGQNNIYSAMLTRPQFYEAETNTTKPKQG